MGKKEIDKPYKDRINSSRERSQQKFSQERLHASTARLLVIYGKIMADHYDLEGHYEQDNHLA